MRKWKRKRGRLGMKMEKEEAQLMNRQVLVDDDDVVVAAAGSGGFATAV